MIQNKRVAVTMPSYYAEKTLAKTVADIPKDIVDNIILNDDCSKDRTIEIGKELGIDLKDIPEGTRASMNGQVPASMKYPEWLRKQPIDLQNQVLGKERAQLWRSGKVKFENFVDSKAGYRSLSLAELKAIEGID